MTDEAKLRQEVTRGERAKRLLENELLAEALEKIEKQIDDAWKESHADAEEIRRNAYLMHRLLQNLKSEISRIAITGDHASKKITTIKKPLRIFG